MVKFQRITTKDTALYNYMERLMTASFPSEEYRPLEELRNYTDTKPIFTATSFFITTLRSDLSRTGISGIFIT